MGGGLVEAMDVKAAHGSYKEGKDAVVLVVVVVAIVVVVVRERK